MLDTVQMLERLSFAADFFTSPHALGSEAAFAQCNLFDVLDCTYLTIWQMSDHGQWTEVVNSGQAMACSMPPEAFTLFNRSMVARQGPTRTATEPETFIWSIPVRIPHRTLVAHLECRVGEPYELVGAYLTVAAKLIAASLWQRMGQEKKVKVSGLTERQEKVLHLMAEGRTYGQIATTLGYSESLVKQEAVKICRIMGVASRYQAVDQFRRTAASASA